VAAALGLHANADVGMHMACLKHGRLLWWKSLVRKLGGPRTGETPLNPYFRCPVCDRPRYPNTFPNPWLGWVRVEDVGQGSDDNDDNYDEFHDAGWCTGPRTDNTQGGT